MIIISLALLRTDQARQALGPATTGNDAEQDLRLPEHSSFADDSIVACQGQLASSTEGVAADGSDHESRDLGDSVQCRVEAGRDVASLLCITELADVGPGSEDPFATGDHHGAGRIGEHVLGRRAQLGEQAACDSALTFGLFSVTTATPSARRSTSTSSPIPPPYAFPYQL